MALDYTPLIKGLLDYKAAGNTFAELSRLVGGVPAKASIGRYASGKIEKPDLDHWMTLHKAAPNFIPPPPLAGLMPATPRQDIESNATIMYGPMRRIPIFDAGAGEPSSFSDSGYPVGIAEDYLELPQSLHLGPNVFAVKVHGDSMSPEIEIGDIVMVDPARALSNGDICFATWSDDDCGDRLVKIFHQDENGRVMLLSKNLKHGPITLSKNDHAVRLFRVVFHVKKL